jgi:hypothetical protein
MFLSNRIDNILVILSICSHVLALLCAAVESLKNCFAASFHLCISSHACLLFVYHVYSREIYCVRPQLIALLLLRT